MVIECYRCNGKIYPVACSCIDAVAPRRWKPHTVTSNGFFRAGERVRATAEAQRSIRPDIIMGIALPYKPTTLTMCVRILVDGTRSPGVYHHSFWEIAEEATE